MRFVEKSGDYRISRVKGSTYMRMPKATDGNMYSVFTCIYSKNPGHLRD